MCCPRKSTNLAGYRADLVPRLLPPQPCTPAASSARVATAGSAGSGTISAGHDFLSGLTALREPQASLPSGPPQGLSGKLSLKIYINYHESTQSRCMNKNLGRCPWDVGPRLIRPQPRTPAASSKWEATASLTSTRKVPGDHDSLSGRRWVPIPCSSGSTPENVFIHWLV